MRDEVVNEVVYEVDGSSQLLCRSSHKHVQIGSRLQLGQAARVSE